jgi:hypothetical protein
MTATEIRPRSPTELVDASFQFLRRFYAPLVTICAIAKAPDALIRIILRSHMNDPMVMVKAPGAWLAVNLIAIASFVAADSILVVAITDGYLKGEVDLPRAFRTGAPRIMAALGAFCIRLLMVLGICVVCIVPFAILVMANVPFAPYLLAPLVGIFAAYPLLRTFATTASVILERERAVAAVKRSFRLTENSLAHIFFSLGLAFVLSFIFSGITAYLGLTLFSRSMAGIVQSLVVIPIYPFFAVVATLLYYDLRIRKEGFDLEVILREIGTDAAA